MNRGAHVNRMAQKGDTVLVVLIGPQGAGVSTVARELAGLTGLPLRDSDRDLEKAFGAQVSDIFLEQGEPAFRVAEQKAAVAAIEQHEGLLVLGSAAPLDDAVSTALAERRAARAADGGRVRVVFLDVTLRDAAARIGFLPDPSGVIGNPRGHLAKQLDERRPVYAGLADYALTTDGRTPDEIASAVRDLVSDTLENDDRPGEVQR